MKALFFSNSLELRKWFEKNHQSEDELFVGYYKKATGKPSISWPESVDVALCFGWIDGIRRSIDEESYCNRFTPRRPKSHWSAVNINRVKELKKQGLMTKSGLQAFERRTENNSKKASYEQPRKNLDRRFLEKIKVNKKAWDYYKNLAPSTKKTSDYWVMSAKKDVTRMKRLEVLIESCEQEKKIPPLRRN